MICPDPRVACAKRCEQQIRAIVRDELAALLADPDKVERANADVRAWLGTLLRNNGGAL